MNHYPWIFLVLYIFSIGIFFVATCDSQNDLLSCLESTSSCIITEDLLVSFFSNYSKENESKHYYKRAGYLLNLRIFHKKCHASKISIVEEQSMPFYQRIYKTAVKNSLKQDLGTNYSLIQNVIPKYTRHSIPYTKLKEISFSPSFTTLFITKTLPSFLHCSSAEKSYFDLKDLFILERDPAVPQSTTEVLDPEGMATLLTGLAHPSSYHSISLNYFKAMLSEMSKYSENFIMDTIYILFRHHISIGKDHSDEMTLSKLVEFYLEYSPNIPNFLTTFPASGDSDRILALIMYLVHEARKEETPASESLIKTTYPGNKVLKSRLHYVLQCSKSPLLGPSVLWLFYKLSKFDIVLNENIIGAISDNASILTISDIEELIAWTEQEDSPLDDFNLMTETTPSNTTSKRRGKMIEFLFLNSGSFVDFSEKSAAFSMLQHLVLIEKPEIISNFLTSYFVIGDTDTDELKLMVKEVTRLFLYIIHKNGHRLHSRTMDVIKNWILSSSNVFKEIDGARLKSEACPVIQQDSSNAIIPVFEKSSLIISIFMFCFF